MCDLPGATEPLHVYSNVSAQSITGGYIYCGEAVPGLVDACFFADFGTGSVYALVQEDGMVTVTEETDSLNGDGVTLRNIASFGEDGAGEMYIVDHGAGAVYQMVAR